MVATTLRLGTIGVPVVVLELVFGVLLGPHVIGLQVTPFIAFLGNVGLGLLFFFAGYEIDVNRIRGAPLELAVAGMDDVARNRLRGRRGSGRRRRGAVARLYRYPILGLRVNASPAPPVPQAEIDSGGDPHPA